MKRFLFAGLGIFFVGLGAIGIWLPLIPTVGPLLVASFCFAKSFPALEQRLIRNKLFAKFVGYLDGSTEMTIKQRLTTIATMWLSIGISGTVLYFGQLSPFWLLAVLFVLGLIGTIVILRFGKKGQKHSGASEEDESQKNCPINRTS